MAPTDEPQGNDILVTLNGINRGKLVREASNKLDELVAAVTRYEKKGTLGIIITVENGAAPDTVNVTASVAVKAPQPVHPAVFFVAEGDTLTRSDPSMDPLFPESEVRHGDEARDGSDR